MKRTITEIGTAALWIGFAFLYVSGCIHSKNKHSDDGDILRYSPYSVYRGLEMFWHDDFKGVDWDERIKNDVATSLSLLNGLERTYDIVNTKEQLDILQKRFSNYPKDKLKMIASGVREALNFSKLWMTDLKAFLGTGPTDTVFTLSPETNRIFEHLKDIFGRETNQFTDMVDSMVLAVKKQPENKPIYLKRLNDHVKYDNDIYSMPFKKLFKEDL